MTRRSVRWTAIIGTGTTDGIGCGVGAANEDKGKKESLRGMPRLEIAHEESGSARQDNPSQAVAEVAFICAARLCEAKYVAAFLPRLNLIVLLNAVCSTQTLQAIVVVRRLVLRDFRQHVDSGSTGTCSNAGSGRRSSTGA